MENLRRRLEWISSSSEEKSLPNNSNNITAVQHSVIGEDQNEHTLLTTRLQYTCFAIPLEQLWSALDRLIRLFYEEYRL